MELPSGDLAVVANAPNDYGSVTVAGEALVIASPYCDLPGCAANENGFIRLTYPDLPVDTYGLRLEITVVSGRPTRGRALMNLVGEDRTRPALLRTQ